MPTDKPHKPEPLTSHDPYPPAPDDQPDPMRERRRNSAAFYASVDAAIAARPPQPSYITRTEGTDEDGYTITHDDGYGTVIRVEPGEEVARYVLEVTSLGETVRLDLSGSLGSTLDNVLRRVLKLGPEHDRAKIVGSR